MPESSGPDPARTPPDRRKLIAVVYADMVGYSRLIGLDDVGTLGRLRALRKDLIDPAIEDHGGRIVNTGGDSLLIVFDSIDGAVRCAVKVQQQMPIHNGDQPADRAIGFRVGVNVGDVVPDGTDVHGDVVNVAAQAECPQGGICVSRQVHDHVQGRLGLEFEELGALRLKNIARPVEAFVVKFGGDTRERKAVKSRDPLPLPDRPSIAVLPFQNMSGDPEQEYFADGIVEEIITGLSRVPAFFVIARNSSFAYRGMSPDVRQVGRELGVRYVLEGSVRKAGSRVRITGQLVEATTGSHLWTDRFEGNLSDIFRLQDHVMVSVIGAVEPKIRMAEMERALRKPTENLEAYDLVLRGKWWIYQPAQTSPLEEAVRLFRRAIALDPNYALAHALLGQTLLRFAGLHLTEPTEVELTECVDLARIAISLGQSDPEALCYAAHVIALPGGDLAEGIAVVDRALAQNSNSADALVISGMLRAYLGDTELAFRHLREADRFSPPGVRILTKAFGFCLACFVDGNYLGVLDWTAQSLRENPTNVVTLRYRTAALALLGRLDEARQTVDRLLAVSPKLTIARCRRHVEVEMKNPYKKPGVAEAYYEGLRLAGLPE